MRARLNQDDTLSSCHTPIATLNNDMWSDICLHLDYWDIRSLAWTSKTMLARMEGNSVWEWMIERDFCALAKHRATEVGWYPAGGFAAATPRQMLRCYFKLARCTPCIRFASDAEFRIRVVQSRDVDGPLQRFLKNSNTYTATAAQMRQLDALFGLSQLRLHRSPVVQVRAYAIALEAVGVLHFEVVKLAIDPNTWCGFQKGITHRYAQAEEELPTYLVGDPLIRRLQEEHARRRGPSSHDELSLTPSSPSVHRIVDKFDIEAKLEDLCALLYAFKASRLAVSQAVEVISIVALYVVLVPGLLLGCIPGANHRYLDLLRCGMLSTWLSLERGALIVRNGILHFDLLRIPLPQNAAGEATLSWMRQGDWSTMLPNSMPHGPWAWAAAATACAGYVLWQSYRARRRTRETPGSAVTGSRALLTVPIAMEVAATTAMHTAVAVVAWNVVMIVPAVKLCIIAARAGAVFVAPLVGLRIGLMPARRGDLWPGALAFVAATTAVWLFVGLCDPFVRFTATRWLVPHVEGLSLVACAAGQAFFIWNARRGLACSLPIRCHSALHSIREGFPVPAPHTIESVSWLRYAAQLAAFAASCGDWTVVAATTAVVTTLLLAAQLVGEQLADAVSAKPRKTPRFIGT